MKPRVALIVLTMNNLSDTAVALESLSALTYPNCEIILVDNGSTDDSIPVLRERFPHVTIIENGRNLGFAAGNNAGLEFARTGGADYMMLLNNDIEVEPDFLDILVEAVESDPRIGMIGPAIYDFEDRPNNVGWRFNPRWGYSIRVRFEEAEGREILDVHTISGCAVMIRRAVYEKIGGLDERLFLLVEDVEWGLRCLEAGWRVVTATRAKLWHLNCATIRRFSSGRLYYEYRNSLMVMRRHARFLNWLSFLPHLVFRRYLPDRRAIKRDRALAGDVRALRLRALRQAFADFLAGRTGRGPAWLSYSR
ncbi:MAG: glycosyltransferase family 2 protein [Planctomycetota bacterium]|nr:MAG: glycosyltransferase family 2 protein [Planctomycetota bacterium]